MPAGEGGLLCIVNKYLLGKGASVYIIIFLLLYQIYIAPLSYVHTFKSALHKIHLIKTYTDTLKHTNTNKIDVSIYIFNNKTVN